MVVTPVLHFVHLERKWTLTTNSPRGFHPSMSGLKKIHLVEDSCVYEIYLKNDSKAQQTLDPLKEKSEQALDWLKGKKNGAHMSTLHHIGQQ